MLFEPVTMFPVAAAIRTARLCGGLRASTPEAQDRRPRHHDNRGLVSAATRVTLDDLARLAEVDIGGAPEPFRAPLQRDAETLAKALGQCGEAVLLSSSGVPGFNPRCRRAPLPRGCARAR
jgi:hypothetical protein